MPNPSSDQVINVPQGGGALHGIGEKFSPDLYTGTGNFSIPIVLPPGRSGFQPRLSLGYSTGHGNGLFGLGWKLDIPGVARRVSKGIPRYDDRSDVFILSGVEDLVPLTGAYPGRVRYAPRSEGLFGRIEHVFEPGSNYWEVRSQNGLTSAYGTPPPPDIGLEWRDPATVGRPDTDLPDAIFAWRLTRTTDSFGNAIQYSYNLRDAGQLGPHRWDQPLLSLIQYADYGDRANPGFLVWVRFEYEPRPDSFSDYRAGFEQRTTLRCRRLIVETHADSVRPVREYLFGYSSDAANGASLLTSVELRGYDDEGNTVQELPALELGYSAFDPARRTFGSVSGSDLPGQPLASPTMDLIDLFGSGMPDIVEMNGSVRYWRNLGNRQFDLPREMSPSPAGLSLAQSGVQLADASGNGRADLVVSTPTQSGYFPLRFDGSWDPGSFQSYAQAPTFDLKASEVHLVDLDGDGATDAVRADIGIECYFSDPTLGWSYGRTVDRTALESFPSVSFADPHVYWADMTGDGLQDVVLVYAGNVAYWPNLGGGNWGARVTMVQSPDLPYDYDPKRVLLGDVDGDGLADLIYVTDGQVSLWLNQSGNGWSPQPIAVGGTPAVTDADAVRLIDLMGTGVRGLLWSSSTGALDRPSSWFLDFCGGAKPYLLNEIDNQLGALTRIDYAPSTTYSLADRLRPGRQWRTPLPFPVQVVSRVESIDQIAHGKLVTDYRYHHGYWDGGDREFRGFGMVEQIDTNSFDEYHAPGLHPDADVTPVEPRFFSPPTRTLTWFHQGAVGDEFGDWQELDYTGEFWPGDPQQLGHASGVNAFLQSFPQVPTARRAKRDALRSLRGRILRTELYAADGSPRADRPYTVSEYAYGVSAVVADPAQPAVSLLKDQPEPADLPQETDPDLPRSVFFAHRLATRTTQWERGDDPMTQLTYEADYDAFGHPRTTTAIACPRGWRAMADTSDGFLTTRTRVDYAVPAPASQTYIFDRVSRTRTWEVRNAVPRSVAQIAALSDDSPDLALIGLAVSFYDGEPFVGLPFGEAGDHGALTRMETLAFTDEILTAAYGENRPPYLAPADPVWTDAYPVDFRTALPPRAGYAYRAADDVFTAGYYATTDRRRYDFQEPGRPGRGLVTVHRPPLGQDAERDTRIAYDSYDLLPGTVTDAVGLVIAATYDYRTLLPRQIDDPNGLHQRFTYSPLGLLRESWVSGTADEGDAASPSVSRQFDFGAFAARGQPAFAHTTRRTHHDTDADVPADERDTAIEVRQYSDGFGRIVQTRALAEDVLFGTLPFGAGVVPADQTEPLGAIAGARRAVDSPPNVVVSGWQVYDNKGQVVEVFEPFFDRGWDYQEPTDAQRGARVTSYDDPRGQVVRTVIPDGSEQRVVLGVPTVLDQPDDFVPTPWEAYTYDANDNAGRTHAAAAAAYAHAWNTPSSAVVDAMGRAVTSVQRNRVAAGDPIHDVGTRKTYDIRGNLLTVTDALDRVAFRYTYDLMNRPLRVDSIDAGQRLTIHSADGSAIQTQDGRGALTLQAFDLNGRVTQIWARNDGASPVTLRERRQFGDGGTPSQPGPEREANRALHRLGRLTQHDDEAGRLTFDAYDFKGNVLAKTRSVVKDSVLDSGWVMDWDAANAADALDPSTYETTTSYDALSRVKTLLSPVDVAGARHEVRPLYNRGGNLEQVTLDGQTYVERIAYSARGQRSFIVYGNGVLTGHAYDPATARLRRTWSGPFTRSPGAADAYQPTSGAGTLQDIAYGDDLNGNILAIHDRTPGCGLAATPDILDRTFSYDALDRLVSASGRECDLPGDVPWSTGPRRVDVTRTRPYIETYDYDDVGNLARLQHGAGAGSFTRVPNLVPGSNQLGSVQVGPIVYGYAHDANGNVVSEATSRRLTWDHRDRLVDFRVQPEGGPPSQEATYLYDAGGQRVKKLVRPSAGDTEATVYVDGFFELQVKGATRNNLLHVLDDQRRVATVRVGAAFPDDGAADKPVQYHLGDHLGNSSVVTGGTSATDHDPINREEYTPYGETSFGSYARKRYRFASKERDDESGLSYFGARYYACWLGRWTSCDPASQGRAISPYWYASANPVNLIDPVGMEPDASLNGTAPNRTGHWETGVPGKFPAHGPQTATEIRFVPDPATPPTPPEPAKGPDPGDAFEPPVSRPEALEAAQGRGRIEKGDVKAAGIGVYEGIRQIAGPLGWLLLPEVKADPRHAGAELIGRQVTVNLALEGAGAVVGKLGAAVSKADEVAEVAEATPKPSLLGPGRRLPIVNPHFQPTQTPHAAVQGAVDRVVAKFEENPELVGNYLSEREVNATLWPPNNTLQATNFGKAVERAVAEAGERTGLLRPTGITRINGRFAPSNDLAGLGPYSGLEFQITTWNGMLHHLETHPEALYVLFNVPQSWYIFLAP